MEPQFLGLGRSSLDGPDLLNALRQVIDGASKAKLHRSRMERMTVDEQMTRYGLTKEQAGYVLALLQAAQKLTDALEFQALALIG